MQHFHLTILIAILLTTLTSCNQTSKSDSTDNSISNNLDFLKELEGKYPYEVKLFDKSAFTQRLKKLIGNSRYRFLEETWAVETPIKVENNIFVIFACQAHNCDSTNFVIAVDFSTNLMYAGIREEGKFKTYSEDGSYPLKVTELSEWYKWVNWY